MKSPSGASSSGTGDLGGGSDLFMGVDFGFGVAADVAVNFLSRRTEAFIRDVIDPAHPEWPRIVTPAAVTLAASDAPPAP